MRQSGELQKEHEELLLRLNNSGYKALEAELAGLNETLEHLGKARRVSQRQHRDCSMERKTGDYVQPDHLGY